MQTRNLTCIGCPMGCALTVEYTPGDKDSIKVTGYTCQRGLKYAIDEVTNPTRTVTGTIRVSNRKNLVVSVKTKDPIAKDRIDAVAEKLKKIDVAAPVKIGDVALANIENTGVDLVITKNID